MKKFFGVLTIIFCLASPAFSQIRWGGWGRLVWLPVFIDQDEEPRSVVQAPWGDEPGLEFMLNAVSENIGADVGVLVERGGATERGNFSQIANAKAWWRPNRYFKLHIGTGRVQELRGKIYSGTGTYAYAKGLHTGFTSPGEANKPYVKIDDGDGIFSRFNLSRMGAIMELTPIPDLFVGAAVMPEWNTNRGNLAEDTYQGIHIAAGYNLRGIGLARFGYLGGGAGPTGTIANPARNSDFSWDKRIEAAFALAAVPHVLADVGLKYSLEKKPGTLELAGFSLQNPLYIAAGAVYTGVEKLRLGFVIDGHFAGTAEKAKGDSITSAPQIAFNTYATYDIGLCEIGGDFSFGAQLGDEEGVNGNNKKLLGFGAFGQKSYANGSFRAGIYANAPMDEGQKWGMTVPVWITYSF